MKISSRSIACFRGGDAIVESVGVGVVVGFVFVVVFCPVKFLRSEELPLSSTNCTSVSCGHVLRQR